MPKEPNPAGKVGPQAGFVESHWYDGEERRTAWLDTRGVVVFSPSQKTPGALSRLCPEAKEAPTRLRPALRIWELPETFDARHLVADLKADTPRSKNLTGLSRRSESREPPAGVAGRSDRDIAARLVRRASG